MTLTGLFIYPVKSLAGISLQEAEVTDRGLLHDRRWMLVDEDGLFLSQRSHPKMALLQPSLTADGIKIQAPDGDSVWLAPIEEGPSIRVRIWDDECDALVYPDDINLWFSSQLEQNVRLVYMPEHSHRRVDPQYAHQQELVGFADGYPFLVISEESLADLNQRLESPVPMNRFRPNLVIRGEEAYAEDRLGTFSLCGIRFRAAKPCARCEITTIDQATTVASKEPLKTLASYRRDRHKVLFGMNLLHEGVGVLGVGEEF